MSAPLPSHGDRQMATFAAEDNTRHTDLEPCQEEVENLRAALRNRPAIDQAKGILMAQHGCSPDDAFDMLSDASQRANRKVRDLAEGVVASVQSEPAPKTTED
jgi:two-component system, response regulator / RNA-binding antiterminator